MALLSRLKKWRKERQGRRGEKGLRKPNQDQETRSSLAGGAAPARPAPNQPQQDPSLTPTTTTTSVGEDEEPRHRATSSQQSTLSKEDDAVSKIEGPRTSDLWHRAYEKLDDELVQKYETLLRKELSAQDPGTSTITRGSIPASPEEQRTELNKIIEIGRDRMVETSTTKFCVAGHEFDIKRQVKNAAEFVLWGRSLVDQAVKASAEASLVWAGVCLILPLLTHPYLAAQANESGFNYVTTRMRYYTAIESRLLLAHERIPEGRKEGLENDIVELYQHVLEFQLKSVLRFYDNALKRFARDIKSNGIWEDMLSQIQSEEDKLHTDFKMITSIDMREELGKASKSLKSLEEIIPEIKEQVRFAKKQLDLTSELVHEAKLTNKFLAEVRLPTVPSSIYDSVEDQHLPTLQDGTRARILKRINEWAEAYDSCTILWLHGPAGTGKSTIARKVAPALAETGQLGASFFFRATLSDNARNSSIYFFPTIAAQLLAVVPGFETCLRKSLDETPKIEAKNIDQKSLDTQFKRLILNPLKMLYSQSPDTWTGVIVVDALDECEGKDNVATICKLLTRLQNLDQKSLRILLTSRPGHPIPEDFKNNVDELSLLDFQEDTKDDIEAFLNARFEHIRKERNITDKNWPGPVKIASLLGLAVNPEPLFIYAATLCHFVGGESTPTRVRGQLELWLEDANNGSQLNQTYAPILKQLLFVGEKYEEPIHPDSRLQLQKILGAIFLLAIPPSSTDLAMLLDIEKDDVNYWISRLYAVLRTRGLDRVEMLHKSFKDLLLGTGSEGFRVDASETQTLLAERCVECLLWKDTLRADICDLRAPGFYRIHIEADRISKALPAHVQYACLFWVHHLEKSNRGLRDGDLVFNFLNRHLLHWLEALSLLGKITESVAMISTLQKLVEPGTNEMSFLYDASRFILNCISIVDMSPLQIYSSALVFSPEGSLIRDLFKHYFLDWIPLPPKMDMQWSPCIMTLEVNNTGPVAFSADGRKIASRSRAFCIEVWDASTGQCLHTFHCEDIELRSVAFSNDSKKLLVAAKVAINTWDLTTCECTRTLLDGNLDQFGVFSPDLKMIASTSTDDTVKIWDCTTAECIHSFDGHTQDLSSAAFSHDSTKVASASSDGTVKIWDILEEKCLHTLQHRVWVSWVTFSPNSKKLASICESGDAWVWDTVAGTLLHHIEDCKPFEGCALWYSLQCLVFTNRYDLRIWDVENGKAVQTLTGHTELIKSMAISNKSQKLVSTSYDRSLRIWSLTPWTITSPEIERRIEKHGGKVTNVLFSPDFRKLASTSGNDWTIKIWDSKTRKCLWTLKKHDPPEGRRQWSRYERPSEHLAFSYDSQTFASAWEDKSVTTWNLITGERQRDFAVRNGDKRYMVFSNDLRRLALFDVENPGRGDSCYKIWDTITGDCLQTLEDYTNYRGWTMTFSPDSQRLALTYSPAAPTLTHGVKIWDTSTGECLQQLDKNSEVKLVFFSNDSRRIATTTNFFKFDIWDIETGKCIQTVPAAIRRTTTGFLAAFSHDSHRFAALDHLTIKISIKIWDIQTASCLQEISASWFLSQMSFSPDDSQLLTNLGPVTLSRQSPTTTNAGAGGLAMSLPYRYGWEGSGWITSNDQRILWVPPEYRSSWPGVFSVAESTVAIGCESGRVLFIGFSGRLPLFSAPTSEDETA